AVCRVTVISTGLAFGNAIWMGAIFGILVAFTNHHTPEVALMAQEKFNKPTELLAQMDGHGIYTAEMLDRCTFDVSMVPTMTVAATREAIAARGLGGELDGEDTEQTVWGYTTAGALADYYTPNGASGKMGRGSSFRDNVELLKAAGH